MKRIFIIFTVLIALFAMTTSALAEEIQPVGEITKPADGEILWGMLYLEATYVDDDPGGVQ
ncbi:MAG TPA: hypothetical protein VJ965_06380, partial [Anaerolineales bacterium]|nr:hypothetical protein [Anaerolineales bacterium]